MRVELIIHCLMFLLLIQSMSTFESSRYSTDVINVLRDDEMAVEASFKQLANADELWGRVIPRIYSTAERGHVAR